MNQSITRPVSSALLCVLTVALCACSSLDVASSRVVRLVKPYQMDIVQGNFVSREQAAALKEGMARSQVRDILGSPLLTSVFHADRWDYVFTFKRQGVETQARRVTVFFKADVVAKIEADALPTEAEFVASLDSGRRTDKVPVLEMSPESLTATAAVNPPVAAAALPPLPTSYPPLEAASN
jgi:outer membrane protein assembly factor BamE